MLIDKFVWYELLHDYLRKGTFEKKNFRKVCDDRLRL